MNDIESLLRRFPPAEVPSDLWGRIQKAAPSPRRKFPFAFKSGLLATSAAGFFAIVLYVLTTAPSRTTPGQDSPEEVFRKIRGPLEKARTIRIVFRLEGTVKTTEGGEQTIEKSGTLLLKEGNKLNLRMKERLSTAPGRFGEADLQDISDGTTLRHSICVKGTEYPGKDTETPKALKSNLLSALLRRGNTSAIHSFFNLEDQDPISPLKIGEESDGVKTLTCDVGPWEVKTWYKTTSYVILKRSFKCPSIGHFTETFDEYSLDQDLPEALFLLPPQK